LKDDEVYIRHILDAIEKIEEYTENISEPDFMDNSLIQDGVVRQIEIIGEAAKQVSKETKDEHPKIQWEDIAGMRDNLIHKYFSVDLEKVLETVEKDIPGLKNSLED